MTGTQHDAVDIIRTKRDGGVVEGDALRWMIDAYTREYVADSQMAAFAMAVLLNGLRILSVAQEWQTVVTGLIIIAAVYADMLRREKRAG